MGGDVTNFDRAILYICMGVFGVAWFVLGAKVVGIRADARLSDAERRAAIWKAQLQSFKLLGLAVAVFFLGAVLRALLP